MSKKLNIQSITNELEGSAFFRSEPKTEEKEVKSPTAPQKSKSENTPITVRLSKNEHINTPPVLPVRDVRPVPLKRVMKQRWPVDIYQDQYESLQKLSLEEKMQGGVGSMSAMVREALDNLISEKNKSNQ